MPPKLTLKRVWAVPVLAALAVNALVTTRPRPAQRRRAGPGPQILKNTRSKARALWPLPMPAARAARM